MPPKISKKSSNSQSNQNIFPYEWEDIPLLIQMKFLELLTLSTALKMIFMCKLNINRYAKYIIHRLQKEKFKYKSIQIGLQNNLVLHQDGSLYAWGANNRGQLGLGHNNQNTPQKVEGLLERAFRLGHENLVSSSMFGNKSSEERRALKNRFLSQHVLNGEINEVHSQRISPGR